MGQSPVVAGGPVPGQNAGLRGGEQILAVGPGPAVGLALRKRRFNSDAVQLLLR